MADTQDLEPLLNTQQSQLDLVLSDATAIDNKSLAVLASNIALLIFIVQAGLSLSHWWMFVLLLMPLVLSLVLDALAIWPRRYRSSMVDLQRYPEYLTMPKHTLTLKLLANTEHAVLYNQKINVLRWRLCAASMLLTALGVTILFVLY